MQTSRVTVLMTPERKASLEARAAERGVSSGEYIRLAVDNFADDEPSEEELAVLIEQVNASLPHMEASLKSMNKTLEETHAYVDALLRDMGLRS